MPEAKAILRNAAHASSADQYYTAHDRYSKDLEEIRKRNVQVIHTSEAVLNAQLAAWDRVIAEQSKEAFFKKVIDSQKAWVKRTQPYFAVASLTTAELIDPVTGRAFPPVPIAGTRSHAAAILLPDNRALIVGGIDVSANILHTAVVYVP